jgi:fructose-1-phosphate kinase PfkB-like protein
MVERNLEKEREEIIEAFRTFELQLSEDIRNALKKSLLIHRTPVVIVSTTTQGTYYAGTQ